MSQNDFNLANQGFPSMRADMNSAFQALASNSSGATSPATTYPYQWWYDDTSDILKFRNGDNDAWIDFVTFDQATDSWSFASLAASTGQFDTSLNVDGTVTADGLDVDGTADATNITRGGSQVFSRDNIIGTVSQSNGIPTGAIIERGSNANGEFVKFADGTMICHNNNLVTPSQGFTWTYPAAFATGGEPSVVGTVITSLNRITTNLGTTTTGVSIYVFVSDTGNASTISTRQVAIGRWF